MNSLNNLPLSNVKVTGEIVENFSKINVEQSYINNSNELKMATYYFPLNPSATIF